MYLIKGLLIFAPPFLYKLPFFNWFENKRKILALLFALIILIGIITKFSFNGWVMDYIIFCIGASLILQIVMANWTKKSIIIIRSVSATVLIGYLIITSNFGPELIDKYEKNNLTFRLYMIPDLVAAPIHRLRITQTWGIFENELYYNLVPGTYCKTYDFDQTRKKLIITETCK